MNIEKQKTGLMFLYSILVLAFTGVSGPQNGIKVENAFVRTAAKGMTSAAYFKIVNSADISDTLYDVEADFTDMAMIHETFRKNGMVGMKQVDFVIIPARDSIEFKPGGYHVMLMNVKEDMKAGMKVNIQLMFRHNGKVEVIAPVKK